MDGTICVVTPAFRAEDTIVATVRSVMAQTCPHWELWLIADDGVDYEAVLARSGIGDKRIRFLDSGGVGRGASVTRNVALEAITGPFVAILDADDRLKPEKLEKAAKALGTHAVVTTALDVMTQDLHHLRFVGNGPDRELSAGTHKWVSLSMDSMVVWDRRVTDARYDPALSNMTDLDLLLQLYRKAPKSLHLGTPLHDYVKRAGSMSNAATTATGMLRSKTEILRRLETGYYRIPNEETAGIAAFLTISLEAEKTYAAALAASPGLLFEDHIEPMLAAASRSRQEV